MNQTPLGTFHSIALDAIRPSPTNPRKNFDQAKLDELTASIREIGVVEPILVRPWRRGKFFVRNQHDFDENSCVAYLCHPKITNDGQINMIEAFSSGTNEENVKWAQDEADKRNEVDGVHEIVTGERRWRAAKAAGLPEIPAVVREMSNEEAEKLQLVENLQRADLHPVEEAEGYRALMATGTSTEDVAKAVGKSTAHIQKLIKLLLLELPAKTLFHAGHLTLGHALLLARLTPADQDRAVRFLLNGEGGDYKKTSTEDLLNRRVKNVETNSYAKNNRVVDETEGALRDWINSNVVLSLAKVPWSLGDAELVPEAGPCTTCPKRSGANAALFADITVDQDKCLDAACFATKQKQSVLVTIKASVDEGKPLVKLVAKTNHQPIGELKPKTKLGQGQWVEAEPMSCSSVTRGLLVEEPPRFSGSKHKVGDVITVCADQKCKVHQHHVDNPSPKGSTSSGRAVAVNYEEQRKQKELKRDEWAKREAGIRDGIFQAMDENVGSISGLFRYVLLMIGGEDDAAISQDAAAFACEKLSIKVPKAPNPWQQNTQATRAFLKYVTDVRPVDLEEAAFYLLAGDALKIEDWHDQDEEEEARKRLWDLAKFLMVDPDAIAEAYVQELEEAAKAAKAAVPAPAKKVATKKTPAKKVPAKKVNTNLTPEARQRIADAMKKRFTERRAAVDGKSAGAGARAEAGVA